MAILSIPQRLQLLLRQQPLQLARHALLRAPATILAQQASRFEQTILY